MKIIFLQISYPQLGFYCFENELKAIKSKNMLCLNKLNSDF